MLIGRGRQIRAERTESGEGYLASSADLMIGILFIFIIMVVYLAIKNRLDNPNSPGSQTDPVSSMVVEIGKRLRDKGVQVELDPDSGVIALPADALFDTGKKVPREEALQAIERTRDVLATVIPCFVDKRRQRSSECQKLNKKSVELETVMVEGHTDSVQYADEARGNNWYLGLDRARYVFEELGRSELGRLRNKKGNPLLGVASYADTRPSRRPGSRDSGATDAKARDRRVELRFILSYEDPDAIGSAAQIPRAVTERLK